MLEKTWQYTFETGFSFNWFVLEQNQQIQSKIKELILLIMKHFRNKIMICVNIYMVKTKTWRVTVLMASTQEAMTGDITVGEGEVGVSRWGLTNKSTRYR